MLQQHALEVEKAEERAMAGLGEDRGKPRPFSWSESLHDYRLRSVFLINIASILEKVSRVCAL